MKLNFHCGLFFACYAVTMFYLVPVSYAQPSRSEREIPTDDDPLLQPLPPGIRLRVFIHTPRVVEPAHLGTCDPITTDSDNYAVAPWRIPPGGIQWKFSESTVPKGINKDDALTAIQDAFGTWNDEFTDNNRPAPFEYDGKSTVKNTRLDGTNAVLWKSLRAGIIGETYVWYNEATGELVEVDTAFNNRHPWAIFSNSGGECQSTPDAYDVQNIATHEFGHWLGLGDVFAEDLTMYLLGAGGELKKRSLGTGDKSGVDWKYPPLP